MSQTRRVVITGLGCVTCLGESVDELFKALLAGKSGISVIEGFDTSLFTVHFGGEIKNFDLTRFGVDSREARRMDLFSQYAVGSAIQAVKDSGLQFDREDPTRVSVIIATGIGGIGEIEQQHLRLLNKGPRQVSPFCVPKLMGNAASGIISMMYGLQGPNFCVVTACASAAHGIGEAMWNIINNRSDISICGGSEAALTPIGLGSFCALKSLSTRNDNPTIASRPFDIDRDGFVMSEGAGLVVLEEYEHARKRGAKIYAELIGYGATSDAHHITAPLPDGSGAARAIKIALEQARLSPDKVDYINAHGTSTQLNDIAEVLAVKSVFGEHIYKISMSSIKSCIGHALGASGGIELIVTVKSMGKSILPPTINLDNLDPQCDAKIDYVPNKAKERKINYALSNSLGFGGHNAALVVGKV